MTHRPSILNTPRRLMAVLAVLATLAAALGLLARPTPAHATTACTVQSLHGNYAGNTSGVTAAGGQTALQALATFNGDGTGTANVTVMTQTSGLTQFTSMLTYTLNSDCTGKLRAVRSTGQVANYVIAVTGFGLHVQMLQVDPGNVMAGTIEHS